MDVDREILLDKLRTGRAELARVIDTFPHNGLLIFNAADGSIIIDKVSTALIRQALLTNFDDQIFALEQGDVSP